MAHVSVVVALNTKVISSPSTTESSAEILICGKIWPPSLSITIISLLSVVTWH